MTLMHASRRSAFHDYTRAVLAERSERADWLRTSREGWLRRLSLQVPLTKSVFLHSG